MQFSPLKPGDEIRIIAPSRSKSIISEECEKLANTRLQELGLKVSFGRNVEESDRFTSSNVKSRLDDIHEAYRDINVKAIMTVIGGFNANQLLPYLDYELIASNPKPLIGYSDITSLGTAIKSVTGIPYYYGPHWSSFGMKKGIEYTLEYFRKALFSTEGFYLEQSPEWSNDQWYLNQNSREFHKNQGYLTLQEGNASGEIIGGNLDTLNLLNGTEYAANLENKVLFIEDDEGTDPLVWDRQLVALMQQPSFKPAGIVVGRFEKESNISDDDLKVIFDKPELKGIPIIAQASFGHTTPIATIPMGGYAKINATKQSAKIHLSNSFS